MNKLLYIHSVVFKLSILIHMPYVSSSQGDTVCYHACSTQTTTCITLLIRHRHMCEGIHSSLQWPMSK